MIKNLRRPSTAARIPPTRNSEQLVPSRPQSFDGTSLNFVNFDKHGDNVMLIVPTNNAFKVKALSHVAQRLIQAQSPGVALRVVKHPTVSGVPEQPLDEEGMLGACNRANEAMAWLTTDAGRAGLKDARVGTVLVGSIENYIDRREPPADHGAVLLCNVGRREAAFEVSPGITVPGAYLAAATRSPERSETVGKLLAQDEPAIAHDNWHAFVTPHSRYDLLESTADAIELRLSDSPRLHG